MYGRKIIYRCMTAMMMLVAAGCAATDDQPVSQTHNIVNQPEEQTVVENESRQEDTMKIKVTSKEYEIIYELNESQAAKELYAQLPLTLEVKDFSTNEKTFYPPNALDIHDAPLANAEKGSLCYYSLWADVVMFYDYFGQGSNLYELGEVVSGKEEIEKLSGMIEITTME